MKRAASYRIEGLREVALAVFGMGKRPSGSPVADAAMQAALKESEERLRLATAAAGIGTFTIDLETGRASYSPELIAMLGLPTICSANIVDGFARVHRDDKPRFMAKYEAGLQGVDGGQIKADFRFVIPGGEIRWMSWIGRVDFRDGLDGRVPFRVAAACVDITERKRAEEAMRESEERFRGIFDHAAIGIAIADLEGRIQSCNPACASMLGYTQAELLGLNFSALVHPEDREADSLSRSRLAQQWVPSFEEMTRYMSKDGGLIWAHKHVSLLRDAAGKPGRMLVLVTDVTERKQQEERNCLLTREVSHRCKNMLSLVQAVARHTFATMPGDFMDRFEKRIGALAASYSLFAGSRWKGAHLEALVHSQLAHFEDFDRLAYRGRRAAPADHGIGGPNPWHGATRAGNECGKIRRAFRCGGRYTDRMVCRGRRGGGCAVRADLGRAWRAAGCPSRTERLRHGADRGCAKRGA